MRTISVRLDDHTDAMLQAFCAEQGVSQTDALKAAIEHLAGRYQPKPAELAAQLGLIGAFKSTHGDLGANHSARLKQALRDKREQDESPSPSVAALRKERGTR